VTLDAGIHFPRRKRGTHFAKVDPNGTSQVCPKCDAFVKKDLSVRVHHCSECGYTTDRDVASAQVIRERGITAAGQVVEQIACGGDEAGAEVTQSSWHPLRQETLRAILGNPRP
jgi:putative transposase